MAASKKPSLTPRQRELLREIERRGVLRLRPWDRRRRVVARLMVKGLVRWSHTGGGFVTTSDYERALVPLRQLEALLCEKTS